MKPIIPHSHRDAAERLAFARFLSAERPRVADEVIARYESAPSGGEKVTRLMVRTLVGAVADAIAAGEAARVADWARMARGLYSGETTSLLVSAACDIIIDNSEAHVADLAGLLVFLGIVRRQTVVATGTLPQPGVPHAAEQTAVSDAILALLKARDEATCTHSRATGSLCRRLAAALGIAPADAEPIAMAGVLHDIGKITTPDAILLKNGPLTSDEWIVMREHAGIGGDILVDIPSLARYAPIVRAHHERIDGLGYPFGLSGNEIPYEARIVSVADAFHAMVSNRPYRNALSYGEAIEALQRGAGTQWDRDIVAVMVEVAVQMRNQSSDAGLTFTAEPPPTSNSASLAG